jgi:hypothetical protein
MFASRSEKLPLTHAIEIMRGAIGWARRNQKPETIASTSQ